MKGYLFLSKSKVCPICHQIPSIIKLFCGIVIMIQHENVSSDVWSSSSSSRAIGLIQSTDILNFKRGQLGMEQNDFDLSICYRRVKSPSAKRDNMEV